LSEKLLAKDLEADAVELLLGGEAQTQSLALELVLVLDQPLSHLLNGYLDVCLEL
jgi:hypothetical protein